MNRDYDSLIEAASGLDADVKIAADTVWRYSVAGKEQQARPLPANVEMRSWGTYANLRQLYAESRVVVVPLARPIISGITVALEGMAMGKPVILTRNPYVEGFIEDGVTGFHVEPSTPPSSAEDPLAAGPPRGGRGHGSAGAAKKAEQDFSVERYVERTRSSLIR